MIDVMNANVLQAIVRRDLKVVFQNKGVSSPLIIAPLLILVVLLPGAAALASKLGYLDNPDIAWLNKVIELLSLMVVTSFASDSFAGEKESKTLEALLYTPTTDRELPFGQAAVGLVARQRDHLGWIATLYRDGQPGRWLCWSC